MTTLFYRRVSTDKQDNSPEFQNKLSCDYARFKKAGGVPLLGPAEEPEVYSDLAVSGRFVPLFQRPGGRALHARVLAGGVGHLVVTKLDRIARNAADTLEVFRWLDERGVIVHIVSFGGDSISTGGFVGKLILTILAAVAEFEGAQIADNTKKGLQNLRDKYQLAGKIPFGSDCLYKFTDGFEALLGVVLSAVQFSVWESAHGPCVGKNMIPNERERETLRQMCLLRWPDWPDQSRTGLSFRQIALQLSARGVPPKTPAGTVLNLGGGREATTTGAWSVGAVARLLGNPNKTFKDAANKPSPLVEEFRREALRDQAGQAERRAA